MGEGGEPGRLVEATGGGLSFLEDLVAVAYGCGRFLAWAVVPRPGAPSGPLWGPRYAGERVARGVQRSETPGGCRAGARSAGGGPLAARRSRRGEAPRGGAVSFGQAAPKVIHRRRVKNRLIKKGLKTVMACGQMTKHYIEQHVGKYGRVSKVNSARVKGQ